MIKKIKQWWKSRTIKAAAMVGLLGIIETNFHFLQGYLGEYYGLVWIPFAVLMGWLRLITTKPIEDR